MEHIEKEKKKKSWFSMQEREKLPCLRLQHQLRNHLPPSKLGTWEATDVLFQLWMKVPQGTHFAFSSSWCQKNNVMQPQIYHPVSGVKHGVLLAPAGKAKVTNNAKQHKPKEEKTPLEKKPFPFNIVPLSQIKEHLLCLVPSLHLAWPMWVSHQTCVAIPPFHTEKTAYQSD